MNTLFLQLLNGPEQAMNPLAWLKTSEGIQALEPQSLSELAQHHAGVPVIAFLPTSDCLLTTVNANEKQLKLASQNLAWLIEEQTAEDADNLHVVATSSQGEESTVVAIAKGLLNQRLESLRQHGFQVLAVLPDLFLLPDNPSAWQLAEWPNNQFALCTQAKIGAVVEDDLMETALDAATQGLTANDALSLMVTGGDALLSRVQEWGSTKAFSLTTQQVEDARLNVLAETDWLRHSANLLQGAFAPSQSFNLPKVWKIAAAFLAVAFAVQLGSEWLHYAYYKQQAKKTQAQAVAMYKRLYPNDSRIINLERQLKAQMQGGGQSDNMLVVLTQVADSVREAGLNTQRLDFVAGSLTLDVNAQAMTDLDRLREKLGSQGLQTEIVSANQQGTVIRGRLRIEG